MASSHATSVLIDPPCALGEGPLWHPDRAQFFWVDIDGHCLHACAVDGALHRQWAFAFPVSAIALVDAEHLLLAGVDGLYHFEIATGAHRLAVPLEADRRGNRGNDGRVHSSGTFWISTMGLEGEDKAGAIYAYREGAIETLFDGLTIPNAICFSPNGDLAYFTDTPTGLISRCALDRDTGLPVGDPEPFIDTNAFAGAPDGAVVDAQGHLWNARFGGGAVLHFTPDGDLLETIAIAADNATCPAFGGPDMGTLVVTSARDDAGNGGALYTVSLSVRGQVEPRVAL